MKLLIDTASHTRMVTVLENEKILVNNIEENDLNLSSRMLPMIKETLESVSVNPKDIDTIYVVTGPGSFTGIRVGVTIAKTWAWALQKKIVPVSELELLATTNVDADYIVPYIDARRDYGYTALYDKEGNCIIEDSHILKSEFLKKLPQNKKIVFVSEDDIEVPYPTCKPQVDVLKYMKKHSKDKGVHPHECNPNYLKKTEAEENLEKGKLHDTKSE